MDEKLLNTGGITGHVSVNLYDCLGNKIDAGNIASFRIEQLFEDTYFNKVPFIIILKNWYGSDSAHTSISIIEWWNTGTLARGYQVTRVAVA